MRKVLFVGIHDYRAAYTRVRCYRFSELLRAAGIPAKVFTLQEAFHPDLTKEDLLNFGDGPKVRLTVKAMGHLLLGGSSLFYIQKAHYHAAAPWLIHRLIGTPYILDYDDYDLDRSPFYGHPFLNRLVFSAETMEGITARLASRAAACVASTRPLVEIMKRYNSRVYHIPTGVDARSFFVPERRPGQTVTFVWCGWVWGPVIINSLLFLFRCLRAVREQFPGARLKIAGEGPWLYPRLKEILGGEFADLEAEVHDWIEPEKMPEFFASADVGTLPLIPDRDNYEWMRCKCPTKLFEYMASGLATVASRFGEAATVIHDGEDGFLASGEREFTEKMLALCQNPSLRHRMGSLARAKVEREYSLESLGPRLVNAVRTVLGRKGALPGKSR